MTELDADGAGVLVGLNWFHVCKTEKVGGIMKNVVSQKFQISQLPAVLRREGVFPRRAPHDNLFDPSKPKSSLRTGGTTSVSNPLNPSEAETAPNDVEDAEPGVPDAGGGGHSRLERGCGGAQGQSDNNLASQSDASIRVSPVVYMRASQHGSDDSEASSADTAGLITAIAVAPSKWNPHLKRYLTSIESHASPGGSSAIC